MDRLQRFRQGVPGLAVAAWLMLGVQTNLGAAELAVAEQLYYSGDYSGCAEIAAEEVRRNVWNDRWPQLLIRCQLTQGKYDEAKVTFEAAQRQFTYGSIALRMLGHQVYMANGDSKAATDQLDRIEAMLRQADLRFTNNDNLVAIGRYYALRGEDARKILELLYDRIRANDPKFAEVYVATAELALSKGDYQEAAKSLTKATELRPEDPYVEFLSAQAWMSSETSRAQAHLQRALKLNPRHVPTLLLVADRLIDAEKYHEAKDVLTEVLSVNLAQPEAWAYHAVIAHLQGYEQGEQVLHRIAQERWPRNPEVEHLIGRKLSQHYRFKEGSAYQRRALEYDPTFLKAQTQLAQDLLRLGDEDAGWALAAQVNQVDGYNVAAHNLVQLRQVIDGFVTLESDGFRVRMSSKESRIYGPAVLELLAEAKATLAKKYAVEVDAPVLVEIFPAQKDFAIRTFGMPGGAGFLGVCFGRVITANSPASQGGTPANWQSVLWHEFCHVITLEKTRNKMPRWLSEGISVYEERQRDPTWGDQMSHHYREMILGNQLTPVSELSSAFLDPPTPIHLQFAYYESSLVVEYLIREHGFDSLLNLLRDLGVGIPINQAMERHFGPLAELDEKFAESVWQEALRFGADGDWNRDGLPENATIAEWKTWLEEHPKNIWGLRAYADACIEQRDFAAARSAFEALRELIPPDGDAQGLLASLAVVYRELDESQEERRALEMLLEQSSDARDAFVRLAEIAATAEDWTMLGRVTDRLLAVNPLALDTQRLASIAAEKLDQPEKMLHALRAMAELDPADPAEVQYRLAVAHEKLGQVPEAKRHVLQALEDAPRYHEALRLLLRLAGKASLETPSVEPAQSSETANEKPETPGE